MEILAFIIVWCASNLKFLLLQQTVGHSPIGVVVHTLGQHSVSPLALIVFPYQHLQEAFTRDAPHLQRWEEVESAGGFTLAPGGSGYHTSTQFLFSKSVTACYKTNLLQHKGSLEITNGLLHPAQKGV